mmetsp:Transcript_168544/g.323927  ORF Transcript_168544/g.323927 Transcript_168544/m.323927 type:complete len:351 (+) Transcript_168544:60-1112(+)
MGQVSGSVARQESELEFFEGTEKRIEADFVGDGDLRTVSRDQWEEVVSLAETKILHHKETSGFISFLLSESSLLVYPGKVILKTCGRTVPLSSLGKILAIARSIGMEPEWLCYSRKNFIAPDEQPHTYRSKDIEFAVCREICGVGDAFVLGPLFGDHWLIYNADFLTPDCSKRGDFTVDIMMYGLPSDVQQIFYTSEPEGSPEAAATMTRNSGLGDIASSIGADVDDYCFETCGYSCNAHAGDAYFMVHVTPQEECSYASFETNYGTTFGKLPEQPCGEALRAMVAKVIESFRPARFTVTLFFDLGASNSVGDAPFRAAGDEYKRRNINTYHHESDYISTVANFVRKGAA